MKEKVPDYAELIEDLKKVLGGHLEVMKRDSSCIDPKERRTIKDMAQTISILAEEERRQRADQRLESMSDEQLMELIKGTREEDE
jgi:hypothetical protein